MTYPDISSCGWVPGAGGEDAWLSTTVLRPLDIRQDRIMMLGMGPEITSLTVWRKRPDADAGRRDIGGALWSLWVQNLWEVKKELWESGKVEAARPLEDGVPERKQTSKGRSQTFSWVPINKYGIKLSLGVVPHTYNPNTWDTETEAGGLSWFKASLGYTVSFRLVCTIE